MDKIIHGICPTCYLTVIEGQPMTCVIGSGESIYYHKDCEPARMGFMRKNAKRWEEDGNECKELREKNGFSVSELAEYIGVSESKLRKFESGKPVTHARLLSLAIIRFIRFYEFEIKQPIKEA